MAAARDERWSQQHTLRPPPYTGAMQRLLSGLDIGDDLVDVLPESLVSPCAEHRAGRSLMEGIPQSPDPDWVDWRIVLRGQALWQHHMGRAFVALSNALLQGFSIARFATVLENSGYATSPVVAMRRYQATAHFWMDWFDSPLNDPQSRARRSIYSVRCMHSFARRRSAHLFSKADGEGVALSQYDLAEVQLGFTGVCLSIMERELGTGPLPRGDREAMIYTWRLIGWHLGIRDDFNICQSAEDLDRCFADYMYWTPIRFQTCRESTHKLQACVVKGFGQHVVLGQRCFEAMLVASTLERFPELDYVRMKPLPCLVPIIRRSLALCGTNMMNAFLRHFLSRGHKEYLFRPERHQWLVLNVFCRLATLSDTIVWPAVSYIGQACCIASRPSTGCAIFATLALLARLLIRVRSRGKKITL